MTREKEIFSLDDYDYELPEELIAQEPASKRDTSRLLVVGRDDDSITHEDFPHLASLLEAGDLLVLNTTKVIPARIFGVRSSTKGKAEVLLLSPQDYGWDVLLKTRGKPAEGETLDFADGKLQVVLNKKGERGKWRATLVAAEGLDPIHVVEEIGSMPLPPYIKRANEGDVRAPMDRERYQTVFAETPGAVAAPTAGLHFTEEFLESLREKGVRVATVTLHVGLGTFQPIEAEDFREHSMHAEIFEVSEECAQAVNATRAAKGRVVAVGTTSLRSLESAWDRKAGEIKAQSGTTRLFIYPPKRVESADCLVTNFHLPRSSLMLLVSAFAGHDKIMRAYKEAVKEKYRFFSYGDAMFLRCKGKDD